MEDGKVYRVVRLVAENYKRLKAADVTPGRNAVLVNGKNRAGKSSLLDAIAAALGGKRQAAEVPIRKGAEDAQIMCVLGDTKGELLVKRTFTADGKTQLEITSAEGYKAPTPQAILDSLYNSLTFDPLAFVRMDEKAQVETLRKLVGLDFTDLDQRRKSLYDERAACNKEAKAKAAQAAGIVVPEGTPDVPVSVADLMTEQKRRQEHNRKNQVERDRLKGFAVNVERANDAIARADKEIKRCEDALAAAKRQREEADTALNTANLACQAQQHTIDVLEDADVDEVQNQIVSAQAVNANVDKAKRREILGIEQEAAELRSQQLTEEIEAVDADKANQLASVKWPIDGLSFGESGVLYKGLPFSQASGAESVSVSFAIAGAMNPGIKICLVRDASLLDDDEMKVVQELAEKFDMQVWLEVVGDGDGQCGILIEDGIVTSGGTPTDAPPVEKKKPRKQKALIDDESNPFDG